MSMAVLRQKDGLVWKLVPGKFVSDGDWEAENVGRTGA